MSTLLLRLAGPLQAWGTSSRFVYRFTDKSPSKSAVLGLLAAAEGRRRTESIEDLLDLRFGVRCDQPGSVLRDFQTARSLDGKDAFPLTYRFYLSDAVFVAGVEGEQALVQRLADAIRRPAFPLYLGRRSCPPSRPLLMEVSPAPLREALSAVPWQAAAWYARRAEREPTLEMLLDADGSGTSGEVVNDTPISFDPHYRRFGSRSVEQALVTVSNDQGERTRATGAPPSGATGGRGSRSALMNATKHDPMGWWESR